jgi:NAD(P)-dependent dehydrogenase (short-subunit alcohol dehydrogenase family)
MTDAAAKVAVVTGGASGIGAAVVRRLSGAGYRVVVADLDEDGGRALAEQVDGLFVRTDVGEFADNEAVMAEAVEAFGRVDVVHLNAGVTSGTLVGENFDLPAYRRVVRVNLDGVVFGIQAALPHLSHGGAIVATASLAGLVPFSDAFYAATKHAVVGLVRSLAMTLPANVTINAVCPGFTDTALIAGLRESLVSQGYLLASPDRVADAVEKILTEGGTGQAWTVQADQLIELVEFPAWVISRSDHGELEDLRAAGPLVW